MKQWLILVFLFGVLITSVCGAEPADDDDKLHSVIAAMITKISAYATLPQNAADSNQEPLVVAVFAEDRKTLETFENVINGKISGNQLWEVKQVHSLSEAAKYQFVFLDDEVPDPDNDWYRSARNRGVITFSCNETKRAVFNFVLVNGKVRFDIHLGLSQLAQVKFDPRLLKLARHLKKDEEQ